VKREGTETKTETQFQTHLDYHRDQQVSHSILEAPDDAKQIRHSTVIVIVIIIIVSSRE
jgi:hypothetical protein